MIMGRSVRMPEKGGLESGREFERRGGHLGGIAGVQNDSLAGENLLGLPSGGGRFRVSPPEFSNDLNIDGRGGGEAQDSRTAVRQSFHPRKAGDERDGDSYREKSRAEAGEGESQGESRRRAAGSKRDEDRVRLGTFSPTHLFSQFQSRVDVAQGRYRVASSHGKKPARLGQDPRGFRKHSQGEMERVCESTGGAQSPGIPRCEGVVVLRKGEDFHLLRAFLQGQEPVGASRTAGTGSGTEGGEKEFQFADLCASPPAVGPVVPFHPETDVRTVFHRGGKGRQGAERDLRAEAGESFEKRASISQEATCPG